jgi:hypothetical protein
LAADSHNLGKWVFIHLAGNVRLRRTPLCRIQVPDSSALEVKADSTNNIGSRDDVHASGQFANDIDTQVMGQIFLIAVSKRNDPRLPASAAITAEEATVGVDVLVMRVRFPVRGFSTAGYHNAGAVLWHPLLNFDRRR